MNHVPEIHHVAEKADQMGGHGHNSSMTRKVQRPRKDSHSFEQLVTEALDELPADIQARLENVQVVIQTRPSPAQLRRMKLRPHATLFGLYEGIPLTQRTSHYNLVLPDKITIFREPIEAQCHTVEEVRQMVRRTVVHELAHYFGISDDRLRELGVY